MSDKLNLTVNPIVAELAKTHGQIIALRGFIGSTVDGRVRVYRDLTLRNCVEIPQDDIVQVTCESGRPEEPCTIRFKSSAELRYVKTVSVRGSDVVTTRALRRPSSVSTGTGTTQTATAARAPGQSPDGPMLPPMDCEIRCELWHNICSDLRGWDWLWCELDYLLCLWECADTTSPGGGGGGVVIQ